MLELGYAEKAIKRINFIRLEVLFEQRLVEIQNVYNNRELTTLSMRFPQMDLFLEALTHSMIIMM